MLSETLYLSDKARYSRHQLNNSENFIVVWLDSDVGSGYSLESIRCAIDGVYCFSDPDTCLDFVTCITRGSVLFVVSSSLLENILPIIHELPLVSGIYIFDVDAKRHGERLDNFRKLKGVYSHLPSLSDEIKRNTRIYERNLVPFNLIGDEAAVISSDENSNQQEAIFMYGMLLKEILCNINDGNDDDDDVVARKDMVEFCRFQYFDYQNTLMLIDEFEREYVSSKAVWWYTRETFLYRMLNTALRSYDISTIYALRLCIRDIHAQLVHLHNSRSLSSSPVTLYRGQLIPLSKFDEIKHNVGGLLSTPSFLSTSSNQTLAAVFAGDSTSDRTMVAVLMKIQVDPTIDKFPFARIDAISYFEGAEDEYLFSMGSVFRILSIEKKSDEIYEVALILTADNDPQLTGLTEHMRQRIEDENMFVALGKLMLEMGEWGKGEEFYKKALATETEWNRRSAILNDLGLVYTDLKQFNKALECYQQTLKLEQQYVTDDDPSLSQTYNNIGGVYWEQKQFDLALEYYERALKIDLAALHPDKENIALRYNNLGTIYYVQNNYEKAFDYQYRALSIQNDILPATHPSLALSYNNIASTLIFLNRLPEALAYAQKAVDIAIQSLPPGHPQMQVYQRTANGIRTMMNT